MRTDDIPYKSSLQEIRNALGVQEAEPLSLRLSTALRQICDDIETYLTPKSRIQFDGRTWCEINRHQCYVCLAGIGMLTGRFGTMAATTFSVAGLSSRLVSVDTNTFGADSRYNLTRNALNRIRVGSSTELRDALTDWRQLLQSHIADAAKDSDVSELTAIADSIGAYKVAVFKATNDWADMIRQIYKGFRGPEDLPQLRALAQHFQDSGF